MNSFNKILSLLGFRLSRTTKIPSIFRHKYDYYLRECERNNRGFRVFKKVYYDVGIHPSSFIDFQCVFASSQLSKNRPKCLLDVGSYRGYILGLLAHYNVTTIDIRKREAILDNETTVTCDAKKLVFENNSFDAVISLCALEHFGLGRYGDEFDPDADIKAFGEMFRVLKPGGILIFSTTVTRAKPSIAFNAHRIYSYEMIREFCEGLELEDEKFYSHETGGFCPLENVTKLEGVWDVYCGCWRKT